MDFIIARAKSLGVKLIFFLQMTSNLGDFTADPKRFPSGFAASSPSPAPGPRQTERGAGFHASMVPRCAPWSGLLCLEAEPLAHVCWPCADRRVLTVC